ncbi:MAG TPA: arginine deiminase family protein [Acidimicrobiia bacterium]|nr:arginine deiminase family protein [Acidimicrobiia bacterium]
MASAWVRPVPETFDQAIVGKHGRAPQVALARRQHSEYVSRLVEAGFDVETIPADDRLPDCVFVEDTAVLLGSRGIMTRPGAPARRPEVESVAALLGNKFPLTSIVAPGTLDGGDVMIMGDTVYVGRSQRTNESGVEQLGELVSDQGMRLVPVDVAGVLHLKSGVLPVDAETVVVTPGTVDEDLLDGLRIVHEEETERHMFSALPLGDTVLVTSNAPLTARRVESLGRVVVPIDVSEILAADGGLTCLSIIQR